MTGIAVPKRNREYRHVPMQRPKPWQVPRPREDFIRAALMAEAGQSHRAIGEAFGVSRPRASVMVRKGYALAATSHNGETVEP